MSSKQSKLFGATDKEIFDALMSAPRKITTNALLELGAERGIFYSPEEDKEVLAKSIALLPHDHFSLNEILHQREQASRPEKISSATFDAELTVTDIKEAVLAYKAATTEDRVISYATGDERYTANLEYTQVDYSRTRLVQRQKKEAGVEFFVEDGKTTVRYPANEKAEGFVEAIRTTISSAKKTEVPKTVIDLSSFFSPEARTAFFTHLISKMPGMKMSDVTRVQVGSSKFDASADLEKEDESEIEQAEADMLNVVREVALAGRNLLYSGEYNQLKSRGFYITAIVWRAKQTSGEFLTYEFDATFNDQEAGRGFKYNVRGKYNRPNGDYTKYIKQVKGEERQVLLTLIENTAAEAISQLKTTGVPTGPAPLQAPQASKAGTPSAKASKRKK